MKFTIPNAWGHHSVIVDLIERTIMSGTESVGTVEFVDNKPHLKFNQTFGPTIHFNEEDGRSLLDGAPILNENNELYFLYTTAYDLPFTLNTNNRITYDAQRHVSLLEMIRAAQINAGVRTESKASETTPASHSAATSIFSTIDLSECKENSTIDAEDSVDSPGAASAAPESPTMR